MFTDQHISDKWNICKQTCLKALFIRLATEMINFLVNSGLRFSFSSHPPTFKHTAFKWTFKTSTFISIVTHDTILRTSTFHNKQCTDQTWPWSATIATEEGECVTVTSQNQIQKKHTYVSCHIQAPLQSTKSWYSGLGSRRMDAVVNPITSSGLDGPAADGLRCTSAHPHG